MAVAVLCVMSFAVMPAASRAAGDGTEIGGHRPWAALVFIRAGDTGSGLFAISDGRAIRRLTSGSDEAPAPSPDGSRVAFS